ncbi:hypothetical protein K2173_016525 [Erythroxylum novogranatense]|uniref:Exonuclease domain-containing protein n=1 Tax=Erythroxylum novogranatense TaxID=1862640 RepID=A0AAV8SSR0_9ROSI|nr:hypothetical protein K2173_016525 [Erythroxylum novogranatense]
MSRFPPCFQPQSKCIALNRLLPCFTMNPILQTPQKSTCQSLSNATVAAHYQPYSSFSSSSGRSSTNVDSSFRWKPMCLYYSQGKCSKMDDPSHVDKFNHDCSRDFPVNAADFHRKQPQDFDFFLVLDLEGKVEILEFPVLIIDAKAMAVVDLFHRFVRPSAMSEQRTSEYIERKYGKFGVDGVWHATALPFKEVLEQFETWLTQRCLWKGKHGTCLNRAAFVTCGNWDLKTIVPHQCKVSEVKLPAYFMEWINLKDVYQNFYNPKQEARGMRAMMDQLRIPILGSHHLGIDDTKNIARVLLRMLADGAVIPITARRSPASPDNVNFLYKNRIR